jgi:PPOX class probable FMN-dependent enzyme
MPRISTPEQLRALIGAPGAHVAHKFHQRLNERAQTFIARSPMLFLATADAEGRAMVSPKGDGTGFVRVADAHTLLMPERKGNKLVYSLQNILANPAVEMIFLLPGTGETLRVSGSAELLDDADLCATFVERGRPALLVMRVRVVRAYFHCAKAFLRSRLWNPETWPAPMTISFGREIAEEGGMPADAADQFDAGVAERYRTDL